jgi:hypothetical protein
MRFNSFTLKIAKVIGRSRAVFEALVERKKSHIQTIHRPYDSEAETEIFKSRAAWIRAGITC